MTTRTFAPWVEPVAAELRETRSLIARKANQIPEEVWALPSPLPEWSYKDLLAHLATGDWVCHVILRTIMANEVLDLATVANLDWVAMGNAERLAARKERPAQELIAEVRVHNDETQELLAQLTAADEERTQEGAPMTLGAYLKGFAGHDRDHLAQLETALQNVMM
ncbi:MAG: DinB family protein [Dehalococcoidia bacterium]